MIIVTESVITMEKQTLAKKCRQMFRKHWTCLPWLFGGLENLFDESISKFEYFCCWIAVMYLIWHFLPAEVLLIEERYRNRKGGSDEDRVN